MAQTQGDRLQRRLRSVRRRKRARKRLACEALAVKLELVRMHGAKR